jgi:Nucleotidyltransferase domain
MPEESLKNKLLNNPKEINDPVMLEEISNLFELQEPETVYDTNGQQKKAIEEAKEQIKNPDIILQQYLPQIKTLMQQYDVQSAYAFGSAVKNTMQPGSDVDKKMSTLK